MVPHIPTNHSNLEGVYAVPAMANIKSQIKRNRQNERRRQRNKAVKAELRTRVKNAVTAANGGAADAELSESLRQAVKRLDKAAAKGIIHKNQAANRKSAIASKAARLEIPKKKR